MVSVVEAVSSILEASPRADAAAHVGAQVANGVVSRIIEGMNVWTVFLTLFFGAVLYDQCEFSYILEVKDLWAKHIVPLQTVTLFRKDRLLVLFSKCHLLDPFSSQ